MKSHLLVLGCLAALGPCALVAQEPAPVRKVVLPMLDPQVRARLAALEARLNPVHSPQLAASVLGQVTAFPWGAFAPVLADERNREVWDQMPDAYVRLTIESGDALVTLQNSPVGSAWSSIQLRRLCQQRLAELPRASLDAYRRRVDAEARALLEEGRRSRSPVPLRRLVDELFCSSPGDDALDLLGDLAFERGHFSQARHWWMRIDRFPGSTLDPVRIEAKKVLALILAGQVEEAREAIAHFRARHPEASGRLANREGPYGTTLDRTLAAYLHARLGNNDEAWTTFGGDATRNRSLTQPPATSLWEDGASWRVKLPVLTEDGKPRDGVPDRTALTRRAAFHPVIVNDQVLIADHRSVVSYHLTTGKELFRFDLKSAGLHDPGPGIDAAVRLPRFTLSVDHDRAYVRLGRVSISPKRAADQPEASYLVCLDLRQPERERKRLLWYAEASSADKALTIFEGAPLVHEGRVYIASAKLVDERVITSIHCYNAQGRLHWTREVCECAEFEFGGPSARHRQHLLTWADEQIVYCSHAGAIVAVDAWTGQPTWGVRYASRGPTLPDLTPSPRDLAPCVYADGRVFAAPLDADRLYCIDAVTGDICWHVDGIEVTHLLGVDLGRVCVATRTGMQAIDVATGRVDWAQPSDGWLPSLGRGLLASGWVYWPTTDSELAYRAVGLRDGMPKESFDLTRLRQLPVGNAAFGHGCLAVAGLEELVVFTPPERQPLPDPRPQARLETLYQQARRARDPQAAYAELLNGVERHPEAFAWRRLIEGRLLALGNPPADDLTPTRMTVLPRDLRVRAAEQALKAGRWSEAADAYRRALLQGSEPATWLDLARAYEGQRDYRSAWDAWTTLDSRFGDRLDPVSAQPYRTLKPSARKEPYASALSASTAAAPILPLVRAWEQTSPMKNGKVHAGQAVDTVFFCTQAGSVTCRERADGAVRWSRPVDLDPTRLERWRDLVIAVGPEGAAAFAVHDGRPTWSLNAPSRRWKVGSVQNGSPKLANEAAGFSHAERWDDSLLVLDDHRRLARVHLATGEVTWQHAPRAAPWRPLGAAFFQGHLLRVGDELLMQDATGRPTWFGSKIVTTGPATRPWPQPPLESGGRVLIPGEQGRVLAYDRQPPHTLAWTFKAPYPSSLTGELCRVFGDASVVLVHVPRNDGHEWVGLDPARGQRLWQVAAPHLPDGLDVGSIVLGETSFYYVRQDRLIARSLNDGSVRWQQDLPEPGAMASGRRWHVRYTKDYLAVHPLEPSPREPFFVGLIDPSQGCWLQRLTFPDASEGSIAYSASHLLVAAGAKVHGFRAWTNE